MYITHVKVFICNFYSNMLFFSFFYYFFFPVKHRHWSETLFKHSSTDHFDYFAERKKKNNKTLLLPTHGRKKSQINQICSEYSSHRYLHTKSFGDKISSMSYMSNIKEWEKSSKWESNIICTDKAAVKGSCNLQKDRIEENIK